MTTNRTDAELDALIEPILKGAGTSLRHYALHMARENMRSAMRAALADAWIPVSKQLPEPDTLVIVHGGIARLNKSLKWITETSGSAGREIEWTVTHWMPLPKAPHQTGTEKP